MARKRNPRVVTKEKLKVIGGIYKTLMYTWGGVRHGYDHESWRTVRAELQPEDDIQAWLRLKHEMVEIVKVAEDIWATADAEVKRLRG